MNLLQILVTLGVGAAIVSMVRAFRLSKFDWHRLGLWLLIWSMGLFVVWFPGVTNSIARVVGVGRGVDVVLYSSVIVLSYMVFRLYVAVEKQDQVITRLVSELALSEKATGRQPELERLG